MRAAVSNQRGASKTAKMMWSKMIGVIENHKAMDDLGRFKKMPPAPDIKGLKLTSLEEFLES